MSPVRPTLHTARQTDATARPESDAHPLTPLRGGRPPGRRGRREPRRSAAGCPRWRRCRTAGRSKLDIGPRAHDEASGQRPAASGQRPAASGQRPAAQAASASERLSPLGSPRRPDARRFTALLPVLALLAGAFSLFAPAPAEAQSTDATLSGLTATQATSASGPFTSLGIGTFAAGTTTYAASVGNSVTHVKLAPTVNESNATVKVGKGTSLSAVASGSASAAIPLSVGANALKVEVTAEDGTTTQTYTVTVTRAHTPPSAPRNFRATAGDDQVTLNWDAPSSWGSWRANAFEIEWRSDTNGILAWRGVQQGEFQFQPRASESSFVFSGHQFEHRVTNRSSYDFRIRARARQTGIGDLLSDWVEVSVDATAPPRPPRQLRVTAGNAELGVRWVVPPTGDEVTGYDVQYTSLSAGFAPDTWPALDESEFWRYRAGNGWVAFPAHRHDGLADDFRPRPRHHLPGAGAGEEQRRRWRLGGREGHDTVFDRHDFVRGLYVPGD